MKTRLQLQRLRDAKALVSRLSVATDTLTCEAERWRAALCAIADGIEHPAEFARRILDEDDAYTGETP